MPADNTHHLTEAARRRAQATRRRAVAALRRMDTSGLPVTIDALAREAAVSRSWIYSQPDLRAEAQRLRDRPRPAAGKPDRWGLIRRRAVSVLVGPLGRLGSWR